MRELEFLDRRCELHGQPATRDHLRGHRVGRAGTRSRSGKELLFADSEVVVNKRTGQDTGYPGSWIIVDLHESVGSQERRQWSLEDDPGFEGGGVDLDALCVHHL